MEPIPLHRVAIVRSFAEFLDEIGASVERGFHQAGLPYSALEDVNNYVPSHRFWAFLVNMAYKEGIEDLGFRVGQKFGANSADPNMIDLLLKGPTFYQGLSEACKLVNHSVSHCRVGLIQPANHYYAYLYHSPSCDAKNPAIDQIGWFGITTLVGMVRVIAGSNWRPSAIGLMTDHLPSHFIREQFPDARLYLSQPVSFITLDNSLLRQTPHQSSAACSPAIELPFQSLADDYVGSLKQVMASCIWERNLNIDHVAELCDTSKRSLQRKLAEYGTSYSNLLDETFSQIACKMLKETDKKIAYISDSLGYSNPTHFTRAFRKHVGITPREYRKADDK